MKNLLLFLKSRNGREDNKGQELKCDDGRVNALLTLTKPLITASTNRYKKAVKGGEHG